MNVTRRTVAVAASLAAGAAVVSLVPTAAAAGAAAGTAAGAKSAITVRASDHHEVDPGEQFVLRGRMSSQGSPVAGATVRVQAYRAGGWEPLSGAVVRTGSDGRYRVRVVLFSGGDRDLRVVGRPESDRIRVARGYTVVRVLG
jgi:hypothetical protein